jgi:hypothetical protein
MSYVIVKARRDEASRDVALVHDLLTSPEAQRDLMKAVGLRAEQELRAWFVRRDSENPNKMGWPRQHFWSRIAKRTAFDPSKTTADSATVVVADPALAAKIDGATIRPTQGRRALTLPMNAEAYATGSPGDKEHSRIPGLFVLRLTATNGAYLVKKEGTGKFANLTFYYWLVPQVTVPKDPQALPPAAQLGAALGATAQAFFRRHGPTGGSS